MANKTCDLGMDQGAVNYCGQYNITSAGSINTYYTNDADAGTYGGYCTCPNGVRYAVGRNDTSSTLFCENGSPGEIFEYAGEWSNARVDCANLGCMECQQGHGMVNATWCKALLNNLSWPLLLSAIYIYL